MGGHNAGDVASEMAVLQLGNRWRETSIAKVETAKKWLNERINRENRRIYDAASTFHDLDGMGTTLVASVIFEGTILIANIGDSRAYNFHEDQLHLVTKDHSFANELLMQGQISEEEAQKHEKKNTLTRSLGVSTEVEIDFFEVPNKESTYILLCSDGLTSRASNEEIKGVLVKTVSLDEKAAMLTEIALEKGATDNISICIIEPTIDKSTITELKGGRDTNGSR